MGKLKKVVYYLFNEPKMLLQKSLIKTSRLYPDKLYLKMLFYLKFGYKLNLKNPQTFSEKLNWLKLYDRKSQYSSMADKYLVKKYVADIIGEEYVVPCYGAWERYEDINFENLPEQFVLKTNHDSSGATICRNKQQINHNKLSRYFGRLLKNNYYYPLREWPYKNIKPVILAEELLVDNTSDRLRDYKFWCFNGVPTFMYCTVKGGDVFENFYDMEFVPVDIDHGYPRHQPEFDKPIQFDKMKELASILSKDIPFVRVDFFEVDGKIYFGEYTFYDWGGMKPFPDVETDLKLGSLINLPIK